MIGARNVMILASAGSGKTYALTNRFVALLALGARPERIVALTFTRKAAGEFFDEILNKLAGAAGGSQEAARLAGDIGAPDLGPADFMRLLRSVIDAMPRLRLGTLDGFFARIVRAFPLELGLAGQFETLEEHAARLERRRALRRLFSGGAGAPAESDFIEEFKRATFGADEKRLGARLDEFLDEHQEIFLAAPEAELWGNPRRIWPEGAPWLLADPERGSSLKALRDWLDRAAPEPKTRVRWEEFLAAVEVWAPGGGVPAEMAYILNKALDAWPELIAGEAAIEFNRKRQDLDGQACSALAGIARGVFAAELCRRLEATRGVHAVLSGYESVYHDAVRRAGKLTFADVQRLLQPITLSGTKGLGAGGEGRLAIEYRIDGEIDHWLLDEFQDTSFGQWSILRNLIDEAVQDADRRRSFFCVGDVKQAIFTWREGDPRLFREILAHYNAAAPDAIEVQHLERSWRSVPPLVEMVNSVFGSAPALSGMLPGSAAKAWTREWRRHESAVQGSGQAALLFAEDEPGRWRLALRLLQELRPLERGLTCAVLVQKNDTGAGLADYLRREGGLPAVAESDLRVCTDNPLGGALLALAQAAAHPGDRLSWGHLRMTPLGDLLAAARLDEPSALSRHLLARIHEEGFERALEPWLLQLERGLDPEDRFSRERSRQFAAAAGRFDQTGSKDVSEFVEFMGRHVVRDTESAAAIRVMTIHKSKGLGFDLVLLPDLEGQTIARKRDGLAVHKRPDRSVDWVFDLPSELFWSRDPVLAGHVEAAKAEASYEKLSLLYVAMTRAKRGLYAIIQPAGSSKSANFPRLLSETLGSSPLQVRVGGLEFSGARSFGDSDWHARFEEAPAEVATPPRIGVLDPAASPRPRLAGRRPSDERSGIIGAAALFSLEPSPADFGAAVHEIFAEVEWADNAVLEASLNRLCSRTRESSAELSRVRLREEALACLGAPELLEVWRRPVESAEAWRERAFEVALDGEWVSGRFDRVVVVRDGAGRAARATVYDFKTDRLDEGADLAKEAARHSGQMNHYRRAAAVLAGLPLERVSAELVFTRARRRVALPV